MTMDFSGIDAYAEHLRTHGRKESTIREVTFTLKQLMKILEKGGRTTDLSRLTIDDVHYIHTMSQHLKDSTLSGRMRVLSRYSIWTGGTDWGKKLDILYNRSEADRVWITLEDLNKLFGKAGPTDRMILTLGAFLGLRRNEMVSIQDEDVDLRSRTLLIHGKGHGVQGLVVKMDLPPDVAAEIEAYRKAKRIRNIEPNDFLLQSDNFSKTSKVSAHTIGIRLTKLGAECGVKVTPHSLRRLYATTLVHEVGADLETVKELMRHASITTTMKCYVKPDPRQRRTAQAGLMNVMKGALESF